LAATEGEGSRNGKRVNTLHEFCGELVVN